MSRSVALLTGHVCVFSQQRIAGKPVIELFHRRFPVDQRKIHTVMFEMAVHAVLAIGILHFQFGVITPAFRQQERNFPMAGETFKRWLAGAKFMALRALCRTG